MSLFEEKYIEPSDDEAGVHWHDICNALTTWQVMIFGCNEHPTVAQAAEAFNTSPELIRKAIDEAGYWVSYSKDSDDPTQQFLELDGE